MCYYVEVKFTNKQIREIYKIKGDSGEFDTGESLSGFDHPHLPIIKNDSPDILTTNSSWGLIPSWSSTAENRKGTLNARIETLEDKASFKNIIQNRCLILSSGYYEWRWLDEKGKQKEKYNIKSQNNEIFAFAGLYDTWRNPVTGENVNSFTMVTTKANEVMSYVHNHKNRMPIMLERKDELSWLDQSINISEFAYPTYDASLIALPINKNEQYGLF